MSPAKFIQVLNIKIPVYSEEMVITAQVLATSRVASSVFFLAFANLGFAFTSTDALEHALPTRVFQNKGIGDAGSTADIRMLWSAMVYLFLL